MPTYLLPLFVLLLSVYPLIAQQDAYSWYQEERFILADRNEDALLSRDEMASLSQEFAFFLENAHFSGADQNGDQHLSFRDVLRVELAEKKWRAAMERRELSRLEVAYPDWDPQDLDFLLENPESCAQLMQNFTWLITHEEVLDQLLENRDWLRKHPEVGHALEQNLRWLAAHPRSARKIYRQHPQPQNPQLLGWRSDHLRFLDQNPSLESQYFNGFLPQRNQR